MKITRKFLTALLALCMLFSVVTPALAVGAETVDSGTCGNNLTWELNSDGTLTISGTGEMYSYTSASSYSWYGSRYKINSVVIKDSVTSIGYGAFEKCSSLTSVVIPDSVTYIGDDAFYYCSSLTSVVIPDSVTSIGYGAFCGCSSLINVTIPDRVTWIGNDAFAWCDSLTSVTIPDSVTSIGAGTFEDCSSLISVIIPDSVTSIGSYAFAGCSSLTSITIPNSVTSIGDEAFVYCDSLTSVTIPDSVTSIGEDAFESCNSLKGIWIDEDNPKYSSDEYGVLFNKDKTNIVQVPDGLTGEYTIPDSITEINDYAFCGCSLTSVTIPYGIDKISFRMFSECRSLTNVTIPDSVTSIRGSAFEDCSSLISVIIPDSVTGIGSYAFEGCNSLSYVPIPDNVTSIGSYAFAGCSSLTSVTIPNSVTSIGELAFAHCYSLDGIWVDENNPNYSSDEYGVLLNILNKDKTVLIEAPGKLSGEYIIPDSVTSIGAEAFYYCEGLTSVTISDSVTYIGDSAFFGCSSLTSVVIPDSVTYISSYEFEHCDSLTSITFAGDAPEISSNCFYDVTTTVYYPAGNATWTDEVMQDYGGDITWVAYEAGETEVVLEAKTDTTEYLVNMPVTITVVTDKSVNNINLVNENGKYIVKTDSSCEENADGTLTWTVSTSFSTKGERSISIFTVDENGESVDSGVTVSFIVDTVISGGDDEVATYMVKAPTSAVKNESFVITVETSTSTTKVGIFNESGSALGKVSQSYADKDGVRTWTIGIKIGSRGDRTLTVKAADRSDTWSDGKQVNISVK